MKKSIAILVLILMGLLAAPAVISQVPLPPILLSVPFWQWPALYSASENLVIKRGTDTAGVPNGKVYLRIGWGGCLGVFEDEFDDLVVAAQTDRYINMRDYAEQQLIDDNAANGWSAEDSYNCPDQPVDGTLIEDYVFQ